MTPEMVVFMLPFQESKQMTPGAIRHLGAYGIGILSLFQEKQRRNYTTKTTLQERIRYNLSIAFYLKSILFGKRANPVSLMSRA